MKKIVSLFIMTFTLLLLLTSCNDSKNNQPNVYTHADMSEIDFGYTNVEFDNQYHILEITKGLPEGVSVSYTENCFKDIGEHEVTATFTVDENNYHYYPISPITAILNISKRKLRITNSSILLKYNEKVQTIEPIFDGELDGFPVEYDINYSSEIKEVGHYTATINLKNNNIYEFDINRDNTIYINVEKKLFDVTFKSEGKQDIVYQVPYGDSLELNKQPFAQEGYTTSWDQDASVLQNIKENKTINVTLTPNEYKVTFNNNLPSEEELTEEYNITYDSYFENPSNIMKNKTNIGDGYIFKGWSTTRNGEVNFDVNDKFNIANDTTLYAVYDKKFNINNKTITGINANYINTNILDIPSKNYTWSYNEVTCTDIERINTDYSFYAQGCQNVETLIIPSTIQTAYTTNGYSHSPFDSLFKVTNVYYNAKNLTGTSKLFYYVSYNSVAQTTSTLHIGKDVEEMNFNLVSSYFKYIDFSESNSLKVIGEDFFNGTDFGSINLPTSVTTIKANAFVDNNPSTKLTVYYAGTEEDFNKITIDSSNSKHYSVVYQNN